MPPPPPPPVPPPPIVNTTQNNNVQKLKKSKNEPTDVNALLSQIRKGAKLKKATTNDRSAPIVAGKRFEFITIIFLRLISFFFYSKKNRCKCNLKSAK